MGLNADEADADSKRGFGTFKAGFWEVGGQTPIVGIFVTAEDWHGRP